MTCTDCHATSELAEAAILKISNIVAAPFGKRIRSMPIEELKSDTVKGEGVVLAEMPDRPYGAQIIMIESMVKQLDDQRKHAERKCSILQEALESYADPGFYSGVGFMADSPCGGFVEDFSEDHNLVPELGSKPGKKAREALIKCFQPPKENL